MVHSLAKWSRPSVLAAAFFLVSQAACGKTEVLETASADTATESDQVNTSESAVMADGNVFQKVRLGDETLSLIVRDGRCALVREGQPTAEAAMDLMPPCHMLLWRSEPPARGGGPSDGRPVGSIGSAMAWRYPSIGNATVLAVIGDPLQEDLKAGLGYRQRMKNGFHCAGSLQGVLIGKADLSLTPKRDQIGVLCAETGLDEKDFWLLSHPRQ